MIMSLFLCIFNNFSYIYIYRERERKRVRKTDSEIRWSDINDLIWVLNFASERLITLLLPFNEDCFVRNLFPSIFTWKTRICVVRSLLTRYWQSLSYKATSFIVSYQGILLINNSAFPSETQHPVPIMNILTFKFLTISLNDINFNHHFFFC